MKIELDTTRLKKAVEQTRKSLDLTEEKNNKLTKKFISKATDNLKYIASSAIDKFYEDYEPHFYDRTYDLYNMYRVTVTEDEWHIDFDPAWSESWHRVDSKTPNIYLRTHLYTAGTVVQLAEKDIQTPVFRIGECLKTWFI